jgi:hypothetical protein
MMIWATACGASPTSPHCDAAIDALNGFSISCIPTADTLECRATAVTHPCGDIADVTSLVQSWASSDSGIVSISRLSSGAGVARSVGIGDAQITAQANGVTSFATRVRVLPGQPPLVVADIYGQVRLAPTCGVNDGVAGVEVTAIDGVLKGLITTTDTKGQFGWQNIVSPPSVTLRATKAGYQDAIGSGNYAGFPTICISPSR